MAIKKAKASGAPPNERHAHNTIWLTTAELSEYIATPEATLRQWRDRGTRGPRSYKLGGTVRYKKHEVDAWIESQARDTVESLGR